VTSEIFPATRQTLPGAGDISLDFAYNDAQ